MKNIITVFTMPTCPNCPKAKKLCREISEELKTGFRIVDIKKDLYEGLMHQVMETPSIAVNDETIFFGKVPDKKELKKEVRRFLK